MGKGPGLYSEIGKRTRDLLTRDYSYDHKFTVTTTTSTGLAFTSTGINKGEKFLGDLTTQFKHQNVTVDVKADTQSNILSTVTVNEVAPGAKTIFTFTIPDQKSGKVELQYLHDYAGISTAVGLTASPVVDFTGAIGSDGLAAGGEVAFNTASGSFTKYNAGIGFTKPDFSAAVHFVDKGDIIKATYSHTVSPLTRTTVGAEIAHKLSTNENTFTIGGLHSLDPLTTVKARLNNQGKLAAVIQHEWRPKSLVTLSGEVDSRALEKNAKIGLALALKP
ncbi:hypothetical protein O6H91_14G020500 [Diphasiastrum complanatum]|uniref:Uncharacterized protein n=3 Tax=Diphasiastrum complanatum TaxID=34168 RepID=A0ACC2BMT9_DIPCM|nr:hypothetical protein O6H91_14G020500 [Diphasiastrum complanatum]KAJ7530815.1 hypothetical protein O6H91_14G020500 [Diphasiastrum complanatum]KAJ7530816.1 hypothetical protein O6H91_14G020500 [Diphasiastrum complanatum]